MHIEYDLIRTKKRFISNDVQDQIKNIRSEKGKAEAEMKEVETLIEELKEEDKAVCEISAGFAAFLKTYAILPYNDAVGRYLDIQIENEERKVKPDRTKISDLNDYKGVYETKKRIIEKSLQDAKDKPDAQFDAAKMVKDFQQKAFGLKHFGKDIKKVFEEIDKQNDKRKDASSKHGYVPQRPPGYKPPASRRSGGKCTIM